MNEPELFALDWTPPAHTATQPVQHPCGLLQIQRSAQPQMVLTFEADRAMDLDVPELGLILRAEPDRHRSFGRLPQGQRPKWLHAYSRISAPSTDMISPAGWIGEPVAARLNTYLV